jgi:hypothetical protein
MPPRARSARLNKSLGLMMLMPARSAILTVAAAFALIAAAPTPRPVYADGQVWAYRTRPQDSSSLLKINKIEDNSVERTGTIYHICVVGIHLGGSTVPSVIDHLPVSGQTLDRSVIKLVTSSTIFPDSTSGIAQWRAAHGGVFTIPVSEIVETADQSSRKAQRH